MNDPDAAREHKAYKDAYASPMPPDLDECQQLAFNLKQEKELMAARQAWDAKWLPGRHEVANQQSQNRIRKLEEKMKNLGCKCGTD